jgi:molybdate transport system substrate-binding protein
MSKTPNRRSVLGAAANLVASTVVSLTSLNGYAQGGDVMSVASNEDKSVLTVFSVNGVKAVITQLAEAFRTEHAQDVRVTYGTIGVLEDKMSGGELPDVLLAMEAGIAKAKQQGRIEKDYAPEIGGTGLGVAVKDGAPQPDISTSERFRDTLLSVKSFAYTDPRTGAASGVAVAEILRDLKIADQVKDKAVVLSGEPVGEAVARGRVELGIQQVTELLPVKGITLLRSFPADLQRVTVYQAAITVGTKNRKSAADFIAFVTSAKAKPVFVAAGFGSR